MSKPQKTRIHTILTHFGFQFDEGLAMFLLTQFGEEKYPGVSNAEVVYLRTLRLHEGDTAESLEAEGILCVGVGGGKFDEHATDDAPAKEGDCAATLVAKHLGIANDPALRGLLAYAYHCDTETGVSQYEIAAAMKAMQDLWPDEPQRILDWLFAYLLALRADQREYRLAIPIFDKEEETIDVRAEWGDGNPCTMATVISSNTKLVRVAFSSKNRRSILVQQNPKTGQVQIYTNKAHRVVLLAVAAALRLEEAKCAGRDVSNEKPEDWEYEGTVRGDDRWFYFKKGEMLFNGSKTRPDVPPTRIPLEVILEIVAQKAFCEAIFTDEVPEDASL